MRFSRNPLKDLWSAAADGRQIRGYAIVSYRAVQFNATGLAFALFQAPCDPVVFPPGIAASQVDVEGLQVCKGLISSLAQASARSPLGASDAGIVAQPLFITNSR